jgi:hypothetical protein
MTTNGTAPRPADMSGKILTEAARRMLPVLAGRVLTAVADRAVEKVDGLADRLGERTAGGPTARDDSGDGGDGSPGRAGVAFAFLLEQARLFLAFVARLAAQALEMLRRATETLRARRAPEGIDAAPAPEDVVDPDELEDLDAEDDLLDDEAEDEYDDEDAEDGEIEERATARA